MFVVASGQYKNFLLQSKIYVITLAENDRYKYFPVRLSAVVFRSSGFPAATILPP